MGKTGAGKSHVAKAIAYSAVRAGLHVAYVEADELLSNLAIAATERGLEGHPEATQKGRL